MALHDFACWADDPYKDRSLYESLGIPECLHDLMAFAGVKFAPKSRFLIEDNALVDPTCWILTIPCKVDGKRIEIPINDPIDKDDPEGHWRAILCAAADFQYLVNSGQYSLTE